MPRFVALPIVISAHKWSGHTHELPESFRLAVRRHLAGGMVDIMTGDGLRTCKHGDWIVAGPDGQFSVLRAAAFEMQYAEHRPTLKLPERRKEVAHV